MEYMYLKKIGVLIKVFILGGVILVGVLERDLEFLEKYGEKLGLVF